MSADDQTALRNEIVGVLQNYGIVTGYVLVFETVADDGQYELAWVCGNGTQTTENDLGRLSPWRVEGMLRQAIRDIRTGYVRGDDE